MSGKKKGLSHDEKRQRMCDYFHEKKEVMTLKELEKYLPKVKGIVSQTVKDVLQSLVDDGMVDTDKIGAGNFFWSLPSKLINQKQTKTSQLEREIAQFQADNEQFEKELNELESEFGDSDERAEADEKVAAQAVMLAAINQELAQHDHLNPEKQKAIKAKVAAVRAAANRWTDNLETMLDVICKITGFSIELIKGHLEMPIGEIEPV